VSGAIARQAICTIKGKNTVSGATVSGATVSGAIAWQALETALVTTAYPTTQKNNFLHTVRYLGRNA
jgi:hypothetical protein